MTDYAPSDIRTWIAQLEAAGWKRHSQTVWQHPDGRYYLGPYEAWQVMCAERGAKQWYFYT